MTQATKEPKTASKAATKKAAPEKVVEPEKAKAPEKVKFHCSGENNIYTVIPASFKRDPVTGEKKPTSASHYVQFSNHILVLDPSDELDSAAIDFFRDEGNGLIGNTIVEVKSNQPTTLKKQGEALAFLNGKDREEIIGFFDEETLAKHELTRQASKEELIVAFLASGMGGSL